ncbi:Cyclin [Rhizoctonia solani]|uniref:Cyclin n=1 Tax=Rhizoctonia solani TaxID=456999 RepID=A0A8H7IN59_9AGAM|nr:Cyclin [Rhizoctonia solani]
MLNTLWSNSPNDSSLHATMTLPPMHAYNFEHSALRYAHSTRPTDMLSVYPQRDDTRTQRSTPDSVFSTQPKPSRRSSTPESLCTVAQNMPEFVSFIADLLATTQVSQSVITLALRYIYTLKQANPSIRGRRGSEYRLAVTALMLANKFLDDNTYTNKTWSDVSRISLAEINQMEKEFLSGLGHSLYVDQATYESWVLMLTGLIDAKDRETEAYWSLRKQETNGCARHLPLPAGQQPRTHRARSSSPTFPFTFTHPPVSAQQPAPLVHVLPPRPITLPPLDMSPSTLVPTRRVSTGKRSAYDAFSPATASASALPFKRAIPSPDSLSPGSDVGGYLASAYVVDHSAGPRPDLKYLPYHTLASSPADNCGHGVRKAVLSPRAQAQGTMCTALNIHPTLRLDTFRTAADHAAARCGHAHPTIVVPQTNVSMYTPPYQRQYTHTRQVYDTDMNDLSPRSQSDNEVRRQSWYQPSPVIAPFANAGPPGVHWNQAPPPLRTSVSVSAPVYQQHTPTWSPIRSRRA